MKKLLLPGTCFAMAATTASAATPYAVEIPRLGEVFGIPVTNAMITSWVISLVLVLVVRLMIGSKPSLIPGRGQFVVESVLVGLRDMLEPIVGKKALKQSFWLLVALFTYILVHNWSGLLPGVGTVGWGTQSAHMEMPFVRPANADLNMTLAMAAVSMVVWFVVSMRVAGPRLFLFDIFGNKAEKSSLPLPLYYFVGLIFLFVGLIEIISICLRPLSLSVRLYGNVYGGESLLDSISAMLPYGAPLPFYFFELLIGLVQALVFTLLVSVYIGLICNHEEGHEHH